MDSLYTSPRRSIVGVEHWETESPSPSHHAVEGSSSHRRQKQLELASAAGYVERDHGMETSFNHDQVAATEPPPPPTTHHEIDIVRKEFSFDRRTDRFRVMRGMYSGEERNMFGDLSWQADLIPISEDLSAYITSCIQGEF
ncbi:hypothetical protein OIU78_007804 [Salix suchowensis]|nr:hypothetical protein OIU78_007804 [Salix suchowensis]